MLLGNRIRFGNGLQALYRIAELGLNAGEHARNLVAPRAIGLAVHRDRRRRHQSTPEIKQWYVSHCSGGAFAQPRWQNDSVKRTRGPVMGHEDRPDHDQGQ